MNKPIDSEELLKWMTKIVEDVTTDTHSGKAILHTYEMIRAKILFMQSQEKGEQGTLYRKVSVKDRLPKQGFVIVSVGDSFETNYYCKKQFSYDMYGKNLNFPQYWLEEIGIPSPPKMTIEECKDKVAKDNKYFDWKELLDRVIQDAGSYQIRLKYINKFTDEAMELYRKQ